MSIVQELGIIERSSWTLICSPRFIYESSYPKWYKFRTGRLAGNDIS